MLYFEAECPQATVRGAVYERTYRGQWFNPRTGKWSDAGSLASDSLCEIKLPPLPPGEDWGLKLVLEE